MIELRMLGQLDLRGADGQELRDVLVQPKRFALLAYLVMARGGFRRRDTLLGLFWPDLDQAHARDALKQAVSQLRRGLGSDDVIVGRGTEELSVNPRALESDVGAFTDALDAGSIERALELYRGDLLEGFFANGSPEFDEWLSRERNRLRALACHAAQQLARRAEEDGDITAALQLAERAAALSDLDERVLRQVVHLLDRAGDRAGAIRTYETFARRLQAEYGAEPSPETHDLVGKLRARRTPATATPSVSAAKSGPVSLVAVNEPVIDDPRRSGRRIGRGPVYSIAGLALLVSAFTGLGTLGVGAFRASRAAGEIGNKPLIVTEFATVNADSSLGAVTSQAARATLEQSSEFKLMTQGAMADALQRMQRPSGSRIDLPLARELAAREGSKAIVDGQIAGIGSGFLVVTLRLVSADSARVLASVHEQTDGVKDLIAVVDRLSLKLRGRIGELLREVPSSPRLEKASTSSTEALRKYTASWNALGRGDDRKAIALAGEAVAIDSNFANAWVVLANAMSNARYPQPSVDSALTRAHQLRDRIPEMERLEVDANYFGGGPGHDRDKAIAAREELVSMGLYEGTNSLGALLVSRREFARADSLARYRLRLDPGYPLTYQNLISWQLVQGQLAAAESTYALAATRFHGWDRTPAGAGRAASLRYARGDVDGAIAILDSAQARHFGEQRASDLSALASLAMLRGQFRKRDQLLRDAAALHDATRAATALADSAAAIIAEAWFRGPSPRHAQRIDALVAGLAFTAAAPTTREYLRIARAYAFVGRADRARALLGRYENEVKDTSYKREQEPGVHGVLGEIALAEHRPLDAATEFRREDVAPDGPASWCMYCLTAMLARAFDAAGNADSTIAAMERYLAITPAARTFVPLNPTRLAGLSGGDSFFLAAFQLRLGELYGAKGNDAKAAQHFRAFVAIWKDADPDMQPRVNHARQELAKLAARDRK